MQLRAADKDDISYSDFVTRLMRAQWQARQEGALEWRIRRASLPERWSLETFPFARQPGVNRKQIRGFAELEFIAKAENIVLVGETGRGKTGLACGLLLKALENGYRCQFIKAQNLFDEMYASLADRSTRQLLKRLAQLDVLIDEFGYLNLKPEQSNIFFKLMEERYASIPPSSPRISSMTNGRTFWAAGRWWKRCSAVCGITVTPCPLTVRRCASRRVEEHDHGRRRRPGRIHSPGSGGVSQNAGQMGTVRRPDRVLAAQLYQRGVSVSVIENALVLAATRRLIRPTNAPPLGTVRSLAYFLPVIEEVLDLKVGPANFQYLRHKLARIAPPR